MYINQEFIILCRFKCGYVNCEYVDCWEPQFLACPKFHPPSLNLESIFLWICKESLQNIWLEVFSIQNVCNGNIQSETDRTRWWREWVWCPWWCLHPWLSWKYWTGVALLVLQDWWINQMDRFWMTRRWRRGMYVLTCVSYPTSDSVMHTHKEGDLYWVMLCA